MVPVPPAAIFCPETSFQSFPDNANVPIFYGDKECHSEHSEESGEGGRDNKVKNIYFPR